jgi:hypothetical protein
MRFKVDLITARNFVLLERTYVVNSSKLDCPYANLRIVDKGSSSPTFIHDTVIIKWGLDVNPIRLY